MTVGMIVGMTPRVRLRTALESSLSDVDLDPKDQAAVALAYVYVDTIDADPYESEKLGPKLLAVLESLMLTPRARAAVVKGVNDDQRKPVSPLDELRAKRAARGAGSG